MADEMCRKVLELQIEFLKRLQQHEPPLLHYVPLLLQRIVECDDSLLEFTLGSLGQKLRSFAQVVDVNHPEIISIFDGILADDQQFAQECLELLILGQFAKEQNLQKIIPNIGRILTKEYLNQTLIKKIDTPQNNRMHVRLLKDFKDREEIRLSKRMQVIDLQSVYKKGEDIWNVQPDNFTRFLRFDTTYQSDLKLAEKKVQRYLDLGCTSLADEVRKSIEIFREHIEQSYYGFNRITLTNAAVILAKSLGFVGMSTHNVIANAPTYKITVNRNFFGKYNFDPEQTVEFSPHISHLIGSPVYSQKSQTAFSYEPRVYPLHEFSDIMSEDLKKTVELLEAFPDAGNKPIFDHFAVIVPGVGFPAQGNDKMYSILDEKGMVLSYASKEAALKTLDTILIKGKYFYPILVGEKNNKCYFICYFMN